MSHDSLFQRIKKLNYTPANKEKAIYKRIKMILHREDLQFLFIRFIILNNKAYIVFQVSFKKFKRFCHRPT